MFFFVNSWLLFVSSQFFFSPLYLALSSSLTRPFLFKQTAQSCCLSSNKDKWLPFFFLQRYTHEFVHTLFFFHPPLSSSLRRQSQWGTLDCNHGYGDISFPRPEAFATRFHGFTKKTRDWRPPASIHKTRTARQEDATTKRNATAGSV